MGRRRHARRDRARRPPAGLQRRVRGGRRAVALEHRALWRTARRDRRLRAHVARHAGAARSAEDAARTRGARTASAPRQERALCADRRRGPHSAARGCARTDGRLPQRRRGDGDRDDDEPQQCRRAARCATWAPAGAKGSPACFAAKMRRSRSRILRSIGWRSPTCGSGRARCSPSRIRRSACAACVGAGVPVVVTRSAYFQAAPQPEALAAGPGLGQRLGWSRPARPPAHGRIDPRRAARLGPTPADVVRAYCPATVLSAGCTAKLRANCRSCVSTASARNSPPPGCGTKWKRRCGFSLIAKSTSADSTRRPL